MCLIDLHIQHTIMTMHSVLFSKTSASMCNLRDQTSIHVENNCCRIFSGLVINKLLFIVYVLNSRAFVYKFSIALSKAAHLD